MKPYYESPDVTLYHGRAELASPKMLGDIDLVFTDPPADHLSSGWQRFGVKIAAFTVAPFYLPLIPKRLGDLTYRGSLAAVVGRDWIPCCIYTTDDAMFLPHKTWNAFDDDWGQTDHPAQKPLAAVEWFLQQLPGERILDPFAGTGTTLLAARNLGRKAVGIEVEEKWCEAAAKRLSEVKV